MQKAGTAQVAAAQAVLDNAELDSLGQRLLRRLPELREYQSRGWRLMTPTTVMATVSAVNPVVDFSIAEQITCLLAKNGAEKAWS
jgi:hypothetical protein